MASISQNSLGAKKATSANNQATTLVGRATGRARGKGKAPEVSGVSKAPPKVASARPLNIIWDEVCVQELVTWLVTRPADRHVLYHDQSSTLPPPGKRPSGKQKKGIHAAIARHIFEGKESDYSSDPDRFATSVSNHLTA